jgi:hypothetical protein
MKSKVILFIFILFAFTCCDDKEQKTRKQSPYPEVSDDCILKDNVCCFEFCENDGASEGCGSCGGHGSAQCKVADSFACKSGDRGFGFHNVPNEFHYSRSTHFGLTTGGACGFGLYQVCGKGLSYDPNIDSLCDAFCKAYPSLCEDPEGITYRGNYAAPQGNYYTQFWGVLDGDQDNYLSCGECFEVYKTKEDGTDYKPGQKGYQPPILLSIIDSCPCTANVKWCCGSGWDQCGSLQNFKYGCPIPEDSIHLDLSDAAMARLQTGKYNGEMADGIIPNKYRRVPCPRLGNMYIWLRPYSGPYFLAFSVVNSAGFGAIAILEAKNSNGEWVKMIRDPNYSSSHPQERYGLWVTPKDSGEFRPPIDLRLTDGSGVTIEAEQAIKSFEPPADAIPDYYYIDIGVNFPEIPIPDPE